MVTIPGGDGSGTQLTLTGVNQATQETLGNVIQSIVTNNPTIANATLQTSVVTDSWTPPPAPTSQAGTLNMLQVEIQSTSTGAAPQISMPTGYDALIVTGSTAVVVTGNPNATSQLIALNDANNVVNTSGGSGTVVAGQGNNLIGTPTSGGGSVQITAGNGNNTIVAAAGTNTIAAGVGANTVLITGGDNVANVAGASTVFGGAGNDTIGAFGSNAIVAGGSGFLTAFAGGNQNTIIGGSGGGLLSGGNGTNSTIVGGAGADTLIGGTGGGDVLFAAGNGGDLLVAGAGSQTLSGGISTGGNTFITGSGSALIGAGNGNDTIIAGTGQSTVFGGGGSDLFAVFSSHSGGSTLIADFSVGTDLLAVSGFGLTAQQIVAGATVSGAGTTITLPDGTTVILSGVTNLSASNIVA